MENAKLSVPTNCKDVFFKYSKAHGSSDNDFMTTPLGANKWYTYSEFYNIDKGTTIYPETAKENADKKKVDVKAHAFKAMLWKSYTKVSFAVRAPWVVGRFCTSSSSVKSTLPDDNKIENTNNVNPICVAKKDDYNKCYNKMALTYHNNQRAMRENTNLLKLDTVMA